MGLAQSEAYDSHYVGALVAELQGSSTASGGVDDEARPAASLRSSGDRGGDCADTRETQDWQPARRRTICRSPELKARHATETLRKSMMMPWFASLTRQARWVSPRMTGSPCPAPSSTSACCAHRGDHALCKMRIDSVKSAGLGCVKIQERGAEPYIAQRIAQWRDAVSNTWLSRVIPMYWAMGCLCIICLCACHRSRRELRVSEAPKLSTTACTSLLCRGRWRVKA